MRVIIMRGRLTCPVPSQASHSGSGILLRPGPPSRRGIVRAVSVSWILFRKEEMALAGINRGRPFVCANVVERSGCPLKISLTARI